MSRMSIASQPALEAYIGESGEICLKQESSGEENKVIIIPHEHVKTVINWLQILHKEYKNTSDDFNAVD